MDPRNRTSKGSVLPPFKDDSHVMQDLSFLQDKHLKTVFIKDKPYCMGIDYVLCDFHGVDVNQLHLAVDAIEGGVDPHKAIANMGMGYWPPVEHTNIVPLKVDVSVGETWRQDSNDNAPVNAPNGEGGDEVLPCKDGLHARVSVMAVYDLATDMYIIRGATCDICDSQVDLRTALPFRLPWWCEPSM